MTYSEAYAQAGIDLCYCGAEFTRAARALDANDKAVAIEAIKNGLDRLTTVVLETLPREAAEMEVTP